MDGNELWGHIHTERAALASLLWRLPPEQWNVPSLCPGWRVRDVAAHIISAPQTTPWGAAAAVMRGRADFNRMVLIEAQRRGSRPVTEILGDYRRLATTRRRAPGTGGTTPLLDVLVHTQDIAIPLGLEHRMPVDAAAACADQVWRVAFPFNARRRLAGFGLRATDVDWQSGNGPAVEGPMEALLLLLTGRRAWLSRLAGPGSASLKP
ncbi:maleylpyruvate isomerase family mycothiol-dependent enzyme [Sinomonas notoginsengisoli]|uniref:maleylpyruvate isomerase family mycothiol-dependent enzyme n=1 Tax=Sinomonas notoginsengisoli TaxID=1457311 RepID=UPI001F220EAC|nr:maleylpyruvate isomerase family mycothiol-dependent enzyme [Sinomonas notoginsengisoli]